MRVLRIFHSVVVDAWRERERALRALGHEVRSVGAEQWDEGGSVIPLRPRVGEDVEGVRTFGKHPALFVYDPRPLWRELGRSWDVIDIHEEPFALATAEILVIRALRRNRAPYLLYSAQNIAKHYPPPFRWLERRALRRASGVIVCNEAAGRIVERKGFPGRATYIPLGVDTGHFSPGEPRVQGGDCVRVGYVGRLAEHKGVGVLLDAVELEPALRLTMAGAGPLEAACRSRAASSGLSGRVVVLGGVGQSDLPKVLRGFDVLAVPSLTTPGWVEQFGRVAVEAMAAGVPVVASESGSLKDVVGDAGLLVPEGDAAALARALLRVGRDDALVAALRSAGLQRVAECSWPEVARAYDEVYRRITRSGEGPDAALEVIVVAYGSPELLRRSLEPVRELPVTVVDNSSMSQIRALCQSLGVRYLDPGGNAGFGSGVNHGLARRQVVGADVLLLNPDAAISPEGVARLHKHLRAEPDLASVAPAQVDAEGRPQRVAWPFPTPWRSWAEAAGLGRAVARAEYVIGSVLLVRAEALAQVGGFDEAFFLYADETDWARRAATLGWQHALVPSVTALHVGAGTSSDPGRREVHFMAGQERYLRKHHGVFGWQSARAAQLVGAWARSLLLRGARRRAARSRASILRRGPMRVEAEQGVGVLR